MTHSFRYFPRIAALWLAMLPVHAEQAPAKEGDKRVPAANHDGTLLLPAESASLSGETIRLESHDGHKHIGQWNHPGDTAAWKFRATHAGRYLVRIEIAAEADGAVLIVECAGKLALRVPDSENLQTFKTSRVGEITLAAGEEISLTLKPVVDGWQPVRVRKVELVPLP